MSFSFTPPNKPNTDDKDMYLVVCRRTGDGLDVMISSEASTEELDAIATCLAKHNNFKPHLKPTIH